MNTYTHPRRLWRLLTSTALALLCAAHALAAVTAVYNPLSGFLTVQGDDLANTISVSRDAAGRIFVNGGAIAISGGTPMTTNTTLIRIFGAGGNDTLALNESSGALPRAYLSGGLGQDTLTGGSGPDEIAGGAGNDTLRGMGGADTLLGEAGEDILVGGPGIDQLSGGADNDQIVWNPGDGNDVIEGGAGVDALVFNGANVSELLDLSPNGARVRLTRNVANVLLDVGGIENILANLNGGVDQITVNSLAGTAVSEVEIDLATPADSNTGDLLSDSVIVQGTTGNDVIGLTGGPAGVEVFGLSARVKVFGAEPSLDHLVVNALGGSDVIDATAVVAGAIGLAFNGGPGDDVLMGGPNGELLIGGQGNDTLLAGGGDDTLLWNPGDANDVIDGGSGFDTLDMNGANISENFEFSANGSRVRLTRNVAAVVLDIDGTEEVLLKTLGGADNVTINDLTGLDVTEVTLSLAGSGGSGDAQFDTVFVTGTNGDDVAVLSGSASGVAVVGLAAQVNIFGGEAAFDRVVVRTLGGDDVIEGSAMQLGAIQFTGDGGDGHDVLVGGEGNDTLLGGIGDDVLLGGNGLDILDGGPGDNIVIQ